MEARMTHVYAHAEKKTISNKLQHNVKSHKV